jgi:hypothetical protein
MADGQRQHARVTGPFDGFRVASSIETPVRIYDLSEGGCFVTSMHAASADGRPILLKVDLPTEGWLTIRGEVLYSKPPFGYAVRFTEMTDDTRARLEAGLNALRAART